MDSAGVNVARRLAEFARTMPQAVAVAEPWRGRQLNDVAGGDAGDDAAVNYPAGYRDFICATRSR